MTQREDDLIAALMQCHGSPYSDPRSEAIVELTRLAQDEPETAWRIVLGALRKNPPDDVLGLVGAGPLEDLMQSHGREFIDRVESEAVTNLKLRNLLIGIYRGDIDDVTWTRILKISGRNDR